MRHVALVLVLLSTGLVLAAASTSAQVRPSRVTPPADVAAHQKSIHGVYSGQVHETITFDYGSAGTNTVKVRYTFVATENVVNPDTHPDISKHLLVVGSENVTGTGSRTIVACKGDLKARHNPLLFRHLDESGGEVIASPYLPDNVEISSNGKGLCDDLTVNAPFGRNRAFAQASNPTVRFPAKDRGTDKAFDVTYPGPKGGGTKTLNGLKVTEKLDVEAKLSVSVRGG
jgi:hypothetical protein